jgi:hypothetical protein
MSWGAFDPDAFKDPPIPAHSDHLLRRWDHTCPGCNPRPGGYTPNLIEYCAKHTPFNRRIWAQTVDDIFYKYSYHVDDRNGNVLSREQFERACEELRTKINERGG